MSAAARPAPGPDPAAGPGGTGEHVAPGLGLVLREWGRIGCLGFGGPPVHIAMLRELCVERRRWISEAEFEDAIAATNLLPGPASTQLAVLTAWRMRGAAGALVGGLAFVLPGLVLIIALAALFLAGSPPSWVRGAGAGAGAVVAAVAVHAGWGLVGPSARRATEGLRRARWLVYVGLGALATVLAGPWVVVVLLGCGVVELAWRRPRGPRRGTRGADVDDDGARGAGPAGAPAGGPAGGRVGVQAWPVAILAAAASTGGLGALAWTAFKVGGLSYGGGFVIIPLMRADAVDRHGWLTDARFLDAVALGQVTPGPVVHTVAAVGFAAAGVGGALLAAVVAFAPSFLVVLLFAGRFDRLRGNERVRSFLDGAGPAAVGAILGASVPLALALTEVWQAVLLALGLALVLSGRAGVVTTLLAAGVVGAAIGLAGGPLPG
ncbi:chromate efflux transporter [Patulibacter americanus]|uniref:chromate efflux transporter n=1 Tax=Patulibacter americanus TaxID=588672 RepID=UPI0003B6749E|nr:chromate efflux transporter [Patulibacter americanus]